METQNQITQHKKFHLKGISPAEDSSLDQAIKKNNIKSYLRKGMSDISNFSVPKDAKSQTLEDHLLQLKNSCSSLRREINHKESDSQKLRKEAIFANDKRKKITDEKFDFEVKISDLEKKLDQVNNKRDVAAHSCKTYEHILERMKKDDIFYQMKNNQLMREIKQLRTSLNFTEAKNYSLSEMEKLSMHGLKDAHLEIRKQKSLRQAKIENYHQQTNKKKEQKQKLKDQQKKTDKIRELADQIQDAELMRIKKFMEVQKFLKQLLKSKMNRLKNHYEDFYQAFFQIKSRTNAKDANSLKFEFFNFESSYNEKTVWVKHIQEEIEASKKETKVLKERFLELQNDEMQMMEKNEEKEGGEKRLKKHELVEKSLEYEFIWEKIMTWLDCQASKLSITSKKTEDPVQLFNLIHQQVSKQPGQQ